METDAHQPAPCYLIFPGAHHHRGNPVHHLDAAFEYNDSQPSVVLSNQMEYTHQAEATAGSDW